jgi:flagellar motor switch protein FliG
MSARPAPLAPLNFSPEGLMRSARLMRALGPDAAPIWGELTAEEARVLGDAVERAGDDAQSEAQALQSFADAHRRLAAGSSGASVWSRLSILDADTLNSFTAREHPQIIALTLSRLTADASARLLRALPSEVAIDAMQRLLHLGAVHPAALRALENGFENRLAALGGDGLRSGHERIARIFDRLDSRSEKALLAGLENAEPGAGEKVRALMFTFDDLAGLDAAGLQTLLAAADRSALVKALKGAREETAAAFFANMTRRASDLLMEEIASEGAVRRSDVEAARQELVQLARTLIHRGEIRPGTRNDEDDELVE